MATSNIKDIGGEAKTRYYKKLKDVEMDRCPYQIPSDAWKNDRTKWSDLEFQEICVYLTETPGIFTRVYKNRKSLEAHNQFISGWVRTAYCYQKLGSSFMILKAEVMLSQRLNENMVNRAHTLWH